MTGLRRTGELLRPWAGFIGAGLGWALTHQIGSNAYFEHCEAMSPLLALLIGLSGLAIAGAGAFFSYGVYRRGQAGGGARHFLSLISMLAAALFSTALLFQTISSFIIPRCYG